MKYFFDVIAPDMLVKFPKEMSSFAAGRIQLMDTGLCVEAPPEPDQQMMLQGCVEPPNFSQHFELSWYRDIRLYLSNLCIDFYETTLGICEFY